MPRDANLRASDADRELAVSILQRAAGEGRLDADELDERIQVALRARTYGELANTVVDLPAEPDHDRRRGDRPTWAAARRPARRTAGRWTWRTLRAHPILLLVLVPVLAMVATFVLVAATTWMTVLAVALLMGGRSRGLALRRSRAWTRLRPPARRAFF